MSKKPCTSFKEHSTKMDNTSWTNSTTFTGSILVSLHFVHISSDPTVCFLEKAIFYDIDLRAPTDAVWRS